MSFYATLRKQAAYKLRWQSTGDMAHGNASAVSGTFRLQTSGSAGRTRIRIYRESITVIDTIIDENIPALAWTKAEQMLAEL